MGLRKIKKEKYTALVTPPFIGLDYVEKIVESLKEYTIFKNVKQPSSVEGLLSVIEGRIPSINGYLEISRLYNGKGRDLSVSVEFNYIEGTSEEDLNQVRNAIKISGLEQFELEQLAQSADKADEHPFSEWGKAPLPF